MNTQRTPGPPVVDETLAMKRKMLQRTEARIAAKAHSTQHTPGPWAAFGTVYPGPKEKVGYYCEGPGAWVCVADCSHDTTGNGGAVGELEANAAFIVRACNAHDELLAALQRLVTLEGADEDDDGFLAMAEDATVRGMTTADYRAELIEDARAAIAKAEGA